MYTFLNERYYFTLRGADDRDYRLEFRPGEVVLDDDTDVVISMRIFLGQGSFQDLILLPANQSQTAVIDFITDLAADIGAEILQNQVRLGGFLFDSLSAAIINYAKQRGVGILKRYFRQANGQYYDARTGLLMATRALTKFHVSFD